MALNRVRSFQPIGEFWAVRVEMGSSAWRYLAMAYLGMLLGLTRNPVWKKASGSESVWQGFQGQVGTVLELECVGIVDGWGWEDED